MDDDRIEQIAETTNFSGVVAVHERGALRFELVRGYANRALAVPLRPDTRFAIASGGKTLTALAVMRLVEAGALGLNTPVRPILGPDLPLIHDLVTVEQLLGHTSGIGDYLDEDAWSPDDYVLKAPLHTFADVEGFLPELEGHPQISPPGERFAYNNGGYLVLSIVAQRVSGIDFHDLVDREVIVPAGLTATAFLRSDELPGDAALGYLHSDGLRTNVLHLPVRGGGDGGIYTVAADLHTLWLALGAGSVVSPETLSLMTTPRGRDESEGMRYGLGFWLADQGPELIMEGMDAGVSFRSTHDPDTGRTTTVLSNTPLGAWPLVEALQGEN